MMDCVFVQIVFLAKNGGGEGWAQLLVFVVMAVIYGLAALAKSRSEKNVDFDEEEDEEIEKSFARSQQKLKQQQGGERVAAAREKSFEAVQPKESFSQWEPFELKEMQRQQGFIEKQSQELEPAAARPMSKSVTEKEAAAESEEEVDVEFEMQDILDFESSENLRKAILHYEILGKPVSMRKGPA